MSPFHPSPIFRTAQAGKLIRTCVALLAIFSVLAYADDLAPESKTCQMEVPDRYHDQIINEGFETWVAKTVETRKLCLQLAEQGDANAQLFVGTLYAKGAGVARDDAEAARWFGKAAAQGQAEAQTRLGLAYASGDGVPHDPAEAVKWYRLAAEQGNAWGQFQLAGMYVLGYGVKANCAEAVKWVEKAVQQGYEDAIWALVMMYGDGVCVLQDEAKARELAIKEHRRKGEEEGRERPVLQKLEELDRLIKAAEQGDANAQVRLGQIYLNNEGFEDLLEPDREQASMWFRNAAEQGHAAAAEWLAKTQPATAWWLNIQFKATATTVRGLDVRTLDKDWKYATALDESLLAGRIPEDDIQKFRNGTFSFSLTYDLDNDGIPEDFFVGVYETDAGETGRFVAITRNGQVLRRFTDHRSSGFSALLQKEREVRWYECLECGGFNSIRWSGESFILE